ncbi:hypothetical protein AVEN_270683-1 [Araneus ventricosus]|uniref:Uncharacterized protein n=1 Tax=Araneus ventricosus TaxID=182803 RepID=A0A4Y2FY66_ARAVE|nr:hypothetical protein AVEN_270683-1 [Araneus ventricosus]
MLIGQVQALLELRWSHRIIQTHFKMKGIAISLSHISRIKNLKLGSTKNDSKPIKNGRQSKLKKSDLQSLEKMSSKPNPPTQASMAKALNVNQHVDRWRKFITTDEAWIYLSQTNAKSKVQYLSSDQNRRDLISSTTVPHPKGVMVWMGISANEKILLRCTFTMGKNLQTVPQLQPLDRFRQFLIHMKAYAV